MIAFVLNGMIVLIVEKQDLCELKALIYTNFQELN
jgi:hypothetical protein